MTAVLRPILVTAISQMTPAAPGPVTKRKAVEDPNTLMQSTKKAKKDPVRVHQLERTSPLI